MGNQYIKNTIVMITGSTSALDNSPRVFCGVFRATFSSISNRAMRVQCLAR